MNYVFEQKVKMVCGWDSVNQLPALLKDEGFQRPLVVCDQVVRQMGLLERLEHLLKEAGMEAVVFDQVQPDPPAPVIDAGAALCREQHCDCVVAVGGGSTIDNAKGINLLRANEGKILDYANGKSYQTAGGLISIPTTAGTGSELSNGMIVTDPDSAQKLAIIAYGDFTILDPALTATMPASLTVNTGLDVFSHAFEAYTSVLSNPMADAVCEKIMAEVYRWLPAAKADGADRTARQRMAVAASLGGWMLSNACAHVGHSLAHVLGAKFHMPHGLVCAYTLPVTMETIAPAVPEKVRHAGEILGVQFAGTETPQEIGAMTAQAYRRFRDGLLDGKAVSFPIDAGNIQALAEEVVTEAFVGLTPLKVDLSLAEQMLRHIC